jgi:Cu-processing system permease protein
VATGVLLTLVFTALACLVALAFEDRATGLGVALLLWLGAAVLYDGVVLLIAVVFADYPLELPMIGLMLANPIDLGRVLLLLRFDIAALMGYTGAVFERFFGSAGGVLLSAAALLLWTAVPLAIGLRRFRRKDF